MMVRHAFATWHRDRKYDQLWPKIFDDRNGYPPGMRDLPMYRVMTDAQWNEAIKDRWTGKPMPEGLDPEKWDGSSLVWHTLPIHFDQVRGGSCTRAMLSLSFLMCVRASARELITNTLSPTVTLPLQCVPNCDCLPWRTNLSMAYSFHFTCFPSDTVSKPSNYHSEADLMSAVNGPKGTNCLRYFYRDLWYSTFKRAHGAYPAPLWDAANALTKPTNMSALLNPPTHYYEIDYAALYKINGWGRRRRQRRRR